MHLSICMLIESIKTDGIMIRSIRNIIIDFKTWLFGNLWSIINHEKWIKMLKFFFVRIPKSEKILFHVLSHCFEQVREIRLITNSVEWICLLWNLGRKKQFLIGTTTHLQTKTKNLVRKFDSIERSKCLNWIQFRNFENIIKERFFWLIVRRMCRKFKRRSKKGGKNWASKKFHVKIKKYMRSGNNFLRSPLVLTNHFWLALWLRKNDIVRSLLRETKRLWLELRSTWKDWRNKLLRMLSQKSIWNFWILNRQI